MYDHAKDKFIILLRDNIIQQAEFYLKDAGEFYPYGAAIDKNEQIQYISAYVEEEFPASQPLIDILEEGMKKGVADGRYLLGAIGYDVYINKPGIAEKQSALMIRVLDVDEVVLECYVHYSLDNENEVKWLGISVIEP